MAATDPPPVSFLDDDGRELPPEDLDADVADELADRRAARRRATVERWLPDGGGAAIASLVFVLVGWLGASPLVTAVSALAPQGMHRIGELTDDSINFGAGQYFGVTPGLIPVISYGTRALLAVLALVLALRARARERSAMATAAVSTSSLSLLLFVVAGVVMTIGIAQGHGAGVYGVPT